MGGGAIVRGGLLGLVVGCLLLPAPPARAAVTPLGRTCAQQNGVRFCAGSVATRVPSFDGVPLDADLTLPVSGNGPFPTIVMMHGWGGTKTSFESTDPSGDYSNLYFAQHGYAVVNYTARGWGESCGTASSRALDPSGCAQGWHRGRRAIRARRGRRAAWNDRGGSPPPGMSSTRR